MQKPMRTMSEARSEPSYPSSLSPARAFLFSLRHTLGCPLGVGQPRGASVRPMNVSREVSERIWKDPLRPVESAPLMHRPVDPRPDFPALEDAVLTWWNEHSIQRRALSYREGEEPWIFYEGP